MSISRSRAHFLHDEVHGEQRREVVRPHGLQRAGVAAAAAHGRSAAILYQLFGSALRPARTCAAGGGGGGSTAPRLAGGAAAWGRRLGRGRSCGFAGCAFGGGLGGVQAVLGLGVVLGRLQRHRLAAGPRLAGLGLAGRCCARACDRLPCQGPSLCRAMLANRRRLFKGVRSSASGRTASGNNPAGRAMPSGRRG